MAGGGSSMQWAAVSRVAESHQITAAHVQIHAGDLARWLENGSIQIMGRVDRQVQPTAPSSVIQRASMLVYSNFGMSTLILQFQTCGYFMQVYSLQKLVG